MRHQAVRPIRNYGFTLIELMLAMVLGLLLVLGIVSVVTANSQAYRTNVALSQVQENARTGFEILARRVREAGATGCGNPPDRIANTVRRDESNPLWWQDENWATEPWSVIRGFDGAAAGPAGFGTGEGDRVTDTGAIFLQGLQDTGRFITAHNPSSARLQINAETDQIEPGDILLLCDVLSAAIFQVSNYESQNRTVVHNTGEGVITPGNCTKGLRWPTECTTNGNATPAFGPNSQLFRLSMELWYVGFNGRPDEGGRSLYRRRIGPGGGTVTEEMIAGVTDMQVAYREAGDAAFLQTPNNWNNVNAVELTLTLASTDARASTAPGVDDGRISRSFTTVIALRNRLQ